MAVSLAEIEAADGQRPRATNEEIQKILHSFGAPHTDFKIGRLFRHKPDKPEINHNLVDTLAAGYREWDEAWITSTELNEGEFDLFLKQALQPEVISKSRHPIHIPDIFRMIKPFILHPA